jgi:hypothetical protein
MIFSVQRFLEDHFSRRALTDVDQYAVRLANLYGQRRWTQTRVAFEKRMHRIQTVVFRGNRIGDRLTFERGLLDVLEAKFPKKKSNSLPTSFPGGVAAEQKAIARARLSVRGLLDLFKRAVESRAIDNFWKSRTKGKLAANPETAGQGLLGVFLQGVLDGRPGLAVREMASGVGWIDVLLVLASTPHLLELKMLRGSGTPGVRQLGTYMANERRGEGWLVLFDTRNPSRRTGVPETITIPAGTVQVVVVDVNPTPPSRRKS